MHVLIWLLDLFMLLSLLFGNSTSLSSMTRWLHPLRQNAPRSTHSLVTDHSRPHYRSTEMAQTNPNRPDALLKPARKNSIPISNFTPNDSYSTLSNSNSSSFKPDVLPHKNPLFSNPQPTSFFVPKTDSFNNQESVSTTQYDPKIILKQLEKMTRQGGNEPLKVAQLSPEEQMVVRQRQANAVRQYMQSIENKLFNTRSNGRSSSQMRPGSSSSSSRTASNSSKEEESIFNNSQSAYQMAKDIKFSIDKLVLQQLVYCRINDAQAGPFMSLDHLLPQMKLGDVVEVKRVGYSHFSVFLGNDQVLQLQNPLFHNITPTTVFNDYPSLTLISPVKEVVTDCQCRVNNKNKHSFPINEDQIRMRIRVALSTNGTQPYNVFANNCEHFATVGFQT